jgi:hypothetical protein
MKPANYGPFYAAGLYPKLAEIFRLHGYALAVHGSLASDLDLIAVPWIESASDPQLVAEEINATFAAEFSKTDSDPRPHGRIAYKLSLSFANCALDISFTPRLEPSGLEPSARHSGQTIQAQHDETGRWWRGPRGALPKGYSECWSFSPPAAEWKTFEQEIPVQGKYIWWSPDGHKAALNRAADFCKEDKGVWCYAVEPPGRPCPPLGQISDGKFEPRAKYSPNFVEPTVPAIENGICRCGKPKGSNAHCPFCHPEKTVPELNQHTPTCGCAAETEKQP